MFRYGYAFATLSSSTVGNIRLEITVFFILLNRTKKGKPTTAKDNFKKRVDWINVSIAFVALIVSIYTIILGAKMSDLQNKIDDLEYKVLSLEDEVSSFNDNP